MKMRNRLWALLLSFALIITYMPAAVFAVGDEGGSKAVKTFVCECGHYYMGQSLQNLSFEEGEILTIDGDEYIYKMYDDYSGGFFLNGVIDTYESGDYKCLEPNLVVEDAVYDTTTADIEVEIYAPLSEDGDGSWGVFATGTITATAYPKPMSLTYSGAVLNYTPGNEYVDNFNTVGNKITVSFSDNTSKEYIYKEYTAHDEEGDSWEDGEYFLNGEVVLDEDGAPDYDSYIHLYWDIPDEGISAGTTELNMHFETEYGNEPLTVYGKVKVEKNAEPISIDYEGAPLYYYEDADDEEETYYYVINDNIPGNKITLNYDNGTSKEYIYAEYTTYDEDGDSWEDGEYFLNGEVVLDENGDADYEYFRRFDISYYAEDNTIRIYADEESDIYWSEPARKQPKPVSAVYEGCELHYYPRRSSIDNLYTENNKIIITYDDDSTLEYICKPYEDDGCTRYDFFPNGDTEEDTLNEIFLDLEYGEIAPGTTEISFYIEMPSAEDEEDVHGVFSVSPGPAPEKVEFIPGDEDFVVESLVGKYSIDERSFEGEGNKFVVTYTDGSTKEYIWLPDTEENTGELFYLNGDYYETNFTIRTTETELEDGVQKGTHDVTFVYRQNVEINGEEKEVSVPMIYPVTATKQFTYLEFSNVNCPYTGKTVKPAAKLYRYDGKLLATKIYTVDYPKAVKVGYYNAAPKITSTFAGVYGTDYDSIGWFRIVPNKEAISKLTAGKKSFTVYWSKFAWQQATGYQIQYALNSKFTKSKKTVTVTSYKTNKKTIKKLKGKKKYYVRVRAYKTIDGEKLYGPWSKAKYVTTKW